MKKNKPLLPSLKEKKRYLVFEVISEKEIYPDCVFDAIENSTGSLLGELDKGKSGIMILKKHYNEKLKKGLIKVNYKYLDKLRFSLALINKIKRNNVIIRSAGASGILKKAVKRYIAA
ncbi:hypothetical protein JXB41_06195 [Candidatus Woesearchaeota archaeon]|nr:hypothetical protein [Candidatus Woesearchaeota archaeon]